MSRKLPILFKAKRIDNGEWLEGYYQFYTYGYLLDYYKANHLKKEAREHEQRAEWLEELKALRILKNDVMEDFCKVDRSSVDEVYQCGQRRGYNKAIDDFTEELKDYFVIPHDVRVIEMKAEQLKAGVVNE